MKRSFDSVEYIGIPSHTAPVTGQLVEVRRRQWVVTKVQGSGLATGLANQQHLVTLSSLDEDSLGEEICVIWELEPGAQTLERAGLPQITGWDSADKLGAFLDAVRWGAITNADRSLLQSPFRSGISIEDYQLDPLIRAIDMARVNLLIADDVGLGKTIEAGLIIQELLVRHRARTVFIVCPATLQVKWQNEMLEKFGLEFRIVDSDYIKSLRRERGIHSNPWTSFPRLITSMDWAKNGEGLRLFKDILPTHVTYPRKFDILVVDEAHNVAPSAASRYAVESQRTKLMRLISPHFSHRLFLSATPHNGYQESFTSLLELLDDQRFARTISPDEKQLEKVMVRRLKHDIVNKDGEPVFASRKLETLDVNYTEEEQSMYLLLQEFISSRSKGVNEAHQKGLDFIHMLLKKRFFSSPKAFAITLSKFRESLESKRSISKAIVNERILRNIIARTEESYLDDEEMENAQQEAVEMAAELSNNLTASQCEMLDRLTEWASKSKNRIDSKAKAILNWLNTYLKTNGEWNNKRVIMFTEYRATHSWLEQILSMHGYGGKYLLNLHGGTDPEEREKIKAAFQANPDVSPVRILLATDAASEGIDLQNHCNYLIHLEIPWNPNVMEQRNGRIDRHGQKERYIYIWHPVGKGFNTDESSYSAGDLLGDHEYLMKAVLKINRIREDLGSVGLVIANQVEEAMLGKYNLLNTMDAEARALKSRRFVSAEKKIHEKISRLHENLMESQKSLHLNPENIARAVSIALELAEKPPLKVISFPGTPEGKVFEVPMLTGSWGKTLLGLEHPHTEVRRPVTFDHEVVKGRDDVVLIHLNHRLVQMSLRLLREELWKRDDVKRLHRIMVCSVPDNDLDGPAVIVLSRLVISGGQNHILHEEITLSGGEIKQDSFSRIPQVSRLESLFEKAKPANPSHGLFDLLKERFQSQQNSIISTVEARSRERLKFLESTLTRRKDSEVKDLLFVLDDLAARIKEELKDQETEQLQLFLWPEDERNQVRRDLDSLKLRLEQIPGEKNNEMSAIESRYSNPTGRTFPVAVLFLVPESQLRKM